MFSCGTTRICQAAKNIRCRSQHTVDHDRSNPIRHWQCLRDNGCVVPARICIRSNVSVPLSLSLSLPLMQNICKCCFIDEIRYKFTQNGATATSKTLANAIKNMFHDQGFKYHPFVSLFLFYFISSLLSSSFLYVTSFL